MKAIKGLGLFAIVVILISSCFNPPEFAIEPHIEFVDLQYFKGSTTPQAEMDCIMVKINFKDGDGDLGLDPGYPPHSQRPFNIADYYLASDGNLTPVEGYSYDLPIDAAGKQIISGDFVAVRQNETGKLATLKTRRQGYDQLMPAYSNARCDYTTQTVYVDSRTNIIDLATANVIDTLISKFPSTPNLENIFFNVPIYVVSDTVYRVPNPHYNNITVEFLEQIGNGPNDEENFKKIDFNSGCLPEFDARYPVLSQSENESPLEGTLTYYLKSFGFEPVLGIRFFKVRIQIEDRALHKSNIVTTKVYTLDKIRQ